MLTHKGTNTLETARLILRKALPEDAQAMFANWAGDPEVTTFLTWPTHEAVETSAYVLGLWCREYEKPEFYQWIIELKELGQPIGTISVVGLQEEKAEAEIGYCIGRPWWHRGLTSEALDAVLDYLFTQVGMERITAKHDVNNPHSGGVMKKCGMAFQGITPASDRNNRGICDTAHYAITRK